MTWGIGLATIVYLGASARGLTGGAVVGDPHAFSWDRDSCEHIGSNQVRDNRHTFVVFIKWTALLHEWLQNRGSRSQVARTRACEELNRRGATGTLSRNSSTHVWMESEARLITVGCRMGLWTRRPNLQGYSIRAWRLHRTRDNVPVGDVKVANWLVERHQ